MWHHAAPSQSRVFTAQLKIQTIPSLLLTTHRKPASNQQHTHVKASLWTCGQHFCGRKLLCYNRWDTGASGTYSSWFKFPKIKRLKHNEWSFSYGTVVIFKTVRGLRFININVSAHCLLNYSIYSLNCYIFYFNLWGKSMLHSNSVIC